MIKFETNRLICQPFEIEDVQEYSDILNDPEIKLYLPYPAASTKKKEIKRIFNDFLCCDFKNQFSFKITEKESHKIIGSIIAFRLSSCSLDVSYLIGKDYRNKGYMTEALLGFSRYILNDVPDIYHYLQFTVENDNRPSQEVLKKCDAQQYRKLLSSVVWRIKLNPMDLL